MIRPNLAIPTRGSAATRVRKPPKAVKNGIAVTDAIAPPTNPKAFPIQPNNLLNIPLLVNF